MFTILDQTKQVKIQWLQDTNESNVDNLNNLDVKLVLMNLKQTVRIRISET